VPEFSGFDRRGYPMVDVTTGYRGWVATYEQTVDDLMDLDLLERLDGPAWDQVARAADLGCGTGRTASWLRTKAVKAIDGVDITPEMLAVARERRAHDRLVRADVFATGLDRAAYDLVISSLVDEHLPALPPLYAEAARLATPGASFVLVGFHPHFIMTTGMPTHFTDAAGDHVAIATHVHLVSDHVAAARSAGWTLAEMHEGLVDDRWVAAKPSWERVRDHPVSLVYRWIRPAAG
jgi:SAM-dependent methyltransferase